GRAGGGAGAPGTRAAGPHRFLAAGRLPWPRRAAPAARARGRRAARDVLPAVPRRGGGREGRGRSGAAWGAVQAQPVQLRLDGARGAGGGAGGRGAGGGAGGARLTFIPTPSA